MSRRIKKKKSTSTSEENIKINDPVFDKNIYDHLRPENRAKEKAAQEAAGNNGSLTPVFAVVIIGVLIIAFAFSGGFTQDFGGDSNSNNNNDNFVNTNTGGFQFLSDLCLTSSVQLQTHFHLFLSITIFSEPQQIPQGIGDGSQQSFETNDSCVRPIHTHPGEAAGRIHVEVPTTYTGDVTLADVFDIWSIVTEVQYKLSATELMTSTGVVTINSNNEEILIPNPASYDLVNLGSSDEIIALSLT